MAGTTMTRRRPGWWRGALLAAGVLALAGCSQPDGGATSTPTEAESAATQVEVVSESPTPTPTPTLEAAPSPTPTTSKPVSAPTSTEIPSREQMDDYTRTFAEELFLERVRGENIGERYTNDELIAGGDSACDALDGGKPLRGVLIQVAEGLPNLESTDAVAALAGIATGTLCPEHSPQ